MKRQIENARNWFIYWKWEVVDIEQDEKFTKDDKQKHWITYRIAQAWGKKSHKSNKITRVEQWDIERHKNKVFQAIESTTQLLLSHAKK